jgi:hypothetical protein
MINKTTYNPRGVELWVDYLCGYGLRLEVPPGRDVTDGLVWVEKRCTCRNDCGTRKKYKAQNSKKKVISGQKVSQC